ncbi:hypothetical protein VE02_04217 [Pseudogymnoascus sp. 03VT05]|nr:hypothetical protein VE02_04217 [Pseudogymnoascus sp. 03VT05]
MPSQEAIAPAGITAAIRGGNSKAHTRCLKPLINSGSLDKFNHADLTPVIGREFTGVQVVDFLVADQQLVDDLAITSKAGFVHLRTFVVFRAQDITPQQMKELALRITEAGGAPESSGLHIHPLTEAGSELGDQISVISSEKQKKGGGLTHQLSDVSRSASAGWHSDITFEPVSSDYAMLKIHTLPASGGDTLQAEHPVIRTNPVTGWKSVFVNKGFTTRLNGVTKDESDLLLSYLFNIVRQNDDAQVRVKWSKNDLAIWDNRSN